MKRRWIVVSLCLLVSLPACSSRPDAVPRPGDVLIDDSPTADDDVRFYFPEETPEDRAREQALERMSSASLKYRRVQILTNEERGYLRASFGTTIASRVGFLRREIGGAVANSLRDGDRLLLDVSPLARLDSPGQLLEGGVFERRYVVAQGPIRYHFSGGYMALLAAAAIVIIAAPYPLLTPYVRRLRSKELQKLEKLHRLQRLVLVSMTIGSILLLVLLIAAQALGVLDVIVGEFFPSPSPAAWQVTSALVILLFFGAVAVSVVSAIQPYVRELREVEETPRDRRLRVLRALLVMIALPLAWITAGNALQSALPVGMWRAVGGITFLLLFLGLVPLWVGLAFGRAAIDPELRRELLEFAHSQGLKVRASSRSGAAPRSMPMPLSQGCFRA